MNDNPQPEPSARTTLLAFIILAAAVLSGAILLLSTRPEPVRLTINAPHPTATPGPVTVYVTGAVAKSEMLVLLPSGSRAQDAIKLAGGATSKADLKRVNLAAILHDGDQVHVPAQGETLALATPSGGPVVHINTATVEELDTLPGVGPALAAKIIEHRNTYGFFQSLDDLDEVPGIGAALLQRLASLVVFD
jgi:competence protein ComEA